MAHPDRLVKGVSLAPIAWSSNTETGMILLRQCWQDAETWLEAVRADPHILISHEVLMAIMHNEFLPGVQLCFTRDGELIKIQTRNLGLLVYRIGKYVPHMRCWEARWPD